MWENVCPHDPLEGTEDSEVVEVEVKAHWPGALVQPRLRCQEVWIPRMCRARRFPSAMIVMTVGLSRASGKTLASHA